MTLVKWKDAYSVNETDLDTQHQEFIRLINELFNSVANGTSKEIISSILKDFTEYTVTHFKTEEDYFDKCNYPEASSHKQEHKTFIQQLSEFKDSFDKGLMPVSLEEMNFLMYWLSNHILRTDKKYKILFKNKDNV
jgi:hemerythrin-like metal-binding protein